MKKAFHQTLIQSSPFRETTSQLPRQTSTSVEWVQSFEASPTSFGLITFDGYDEMIPAGTLLPARKKISLEGSIYDFFDKETFTVAYRHSPRDAHREIGSVSLTGIRKARAKETKLDAWIEVDSTLKGVFHARDPHTGSEASVAFEARVEPANGECSVVKFDRCGQS